MVKNFERIGLQEIIDKAIEEIALEQGDSFDLERMNLSEFARKAGLTSLLVAPHCQSQHDLQIHQDRPNLLIKLAPHN